MARIDRRIGGPPVRLWTGRRESKQPWRVLRFEWRCVHDVSSLFAVLFRVPTQKYRWGTMMVSSGRTRSRQLDLQLLLGAVFNADDLDAVHRRVLGHPAGQRQGLEHGRVLLDAVRAGILDMPEHVDRLRAWHEDRVAIAQLDVLRQRAAFELADACPEDLGARFLVERARARAAVRPGSNNRHFTGGGRERRTGARQRLDERHPARERDRSGLADLAHDEHALTAVLLDRDRHLWIAEIAVGEPPMQFELEPAQRLTSRLDPADERKAEGAVRLDRELAAEIRLIEHLNAEHVLRSDHVVGCRLRGAGSTSARTQQSTDPQRQSGESIARSMLHG